MKIVLFVEKYDNIRVKNHLVGNMHKTKGELMLNIQYLQTKHLDIKYKP